jgi:hypothetical protein
MLYVGDVQIWQFLLRNPAGSQCPSARCLVRSPFPFPRSLSLRPQDIVVGTSDTVMVQYSCDFNRGGLVRLMGGITYTAHTRGMSTVAGLVLYEIYSPLGQVVSHFVLAVSLRLDVSKKHDPATTWMGFMLHFTRVRTFFLHD